MKSLTQEILSKLISFDTTSAKSNLELISYIQEYLNAYGVESTLVRDPIKNKANLYTTIGPKGKSGVLLSGHTDTVPVTGQAWDTNPYELVDRDGKLFGRGTTDMKGFIAAVLSSVPVMVEKPLATPIHFAFSYDEEVGCLGVRHLLEFLNKQDVKPSMCIIGEPTSMKIVNTHKGKIAAKVTVNGKECHSGMAPKGVNAINIASRLICWLEELADKKANYGPFDDRFEINHTTVHTGVVSGGTALNIVPKHCEFVFEIRNISEDEPQELLHEFRQYSEALELKMKQIDDSCFIKIDIATEYPGLDTDENSDIISFIKGVTGNNSINSVNFGTEGGLFTDVLGVPSVVYGPGSMEQGHKPNEYITKSQMSEADAFLEKLIFELRE